MYPLEEFDGTMKTVDWKATKKVPGEGGGNAETPWVPAQSFFDSLPVALADAPPMPGEEARYAEAFSVIEAAKADPAIRRAVDEAAAEANEKIVEPLFEFRNFGLPRRTTGPRPPTMPRSGPTTSRGLPSPNPTFSSTPPMRPSIFIKTSTARVRGSTARNATR